MRRFPRFLSPAQILVETGDRNELKLLWMQDISKGGLFVRTDAPPPMRSKVQVKLRSSDGTLDLSAEVVHILAPELARHQGLEPGVGLQFVDLSPEKRGAIERYVDGVAAGLAKRGPPPAPGQDDEAIVRRAQSFLRGFENDDLYAALDVGPLTPSSEVSTRIEQLLALYAGASGQITPAQKTRLEHAATVAKRVRSLMLDSVRRLDYDFRHQLLMVEERLALSPSSDALIDLRKAWQRSFPERMAAAEVQVMEALRMERQLDYLSAIKAAKAALAHDPFNPDLRPAIRNWERRLEARRGPKPTPRKAQAS